MHYTDVLIVCAVIAAQGAIVFGTAYFGLRLSKKDGPLARMGAMALSYVVWSGFILDVFAVVRHRTDDLLATAIWVAGLISLFVYLYVWARLSPAHAGGAAPNGNGDRGRAATAADRRSGCRENAELRTTFPDDMVEDGDEIILFAGRNVAEALVNVLRDLGYQATDPEDQQEHGWDFTAGDGRSEVWMQVCSLSEFYCLLQTDGPSWLPEEGVTAPYPRMLTRLSGALAMDERFVDVRWIWEDEIETQAQGASEPCAP